MCIRDSLRFGQFVGCQVGSLKPVGTGDDIFFAVFIYIGHRRAFGNKIAGKGLFGKGYLARLFGFVLGTRVVTACQQRQYLSLIHI